MIEVIYCLDHKKSSSKLVEHLNERGVEATLGREITHPDSFVVMWGMNGERGLNSCIRRDKYWQLRKMHAARVPCVEHTRVRTVAADWLAHGATVLLRKDFHEGGGRDIVKFVPAQGKAAVEHCEVNGGYFTKFVPSTEEWRFHIWKGLSISGYVKSETDRNGNGHAPSLSREKLRKISKDAVAALGYDFGAVDILGCGVVLEVNTAPALDYQRLVEVYGNAVVRSVG